MKASISGMATKHHAEGAPGTPILSVENQRGVDVDFLFLFFIAGASVDGCQQTRPALLRRSEAFRAGVTLTRRAATLKAWSWSTWSAVGVAGRGQLLQL